MRFIAAVLTVASLAASANAAEPTRMSDAQFIEANRCLGIESSKALGTSHEAAFKQLVKTQNWARDSYIYEKADEARDTAAREASRGSASLNERLVSERDGVCRSFLDTTTASAPGASHSM